MEPRLSGAPFAASTTEAAARDRREPEPLTSRQRQVEEPRQTRAGQQSGRISQVVGDSASKYQLHYERLVQPTTASVASSASSASASSASSSSSSSAASCSSRSSGRGAAGSAMARAGHEHADETQQRRPKRGSASQESAASSRKSQDGHQQPEADGKSSKRRPEKKQISADLGAAESGAAQPTPTTNAAEVAAARFKTRDLSYADDGVR